MATYKIYNDYNTITLNNSVTNKIITTSMFGDTTNNSNVYFGLKDVDNNYINKLSDNTYKIVSDENDNCYFITDNTAADHNTAQLIKLTISSLSSNTLLTFKYNGTILFKVNYQKQNKGRIIFLRPNIYYLYQDKKLSDYLLYMVYEYTGADILNTTGLPYDACNGLYTFNPNDIITIKNIFYYYDFDNNFNISDSYTWEDLDNIYNFTFIDGTLDIRNDSSYYDAGLIDLNYLSQQGTGERMDNISKYFDDNLKPKTSGPYILHAVLYRAYVNDNNSQYKYEAVSSWRSYIPWQPSASNNQYGIYYYDY